MRIPVRGWRWRSSPLRRRSDVVEAWTTVAVALLLFVGAPLVGAVTAWWAYGSATATVTAQREQRYAVRAEVVGAPPESRPAVGGGPHMYRTQVRWTEPGEQPRTATARVPGRAREGDVVDVWFDRQGRTVAPPTDGSLVWQHTVTLGACAVAGAALLVLLARTAVRRIALGHRLDEWERAWARTEPEWTRRRA
ncbi:hypothetical protein ACIQAC_22580 [Streptomyces sp. NPDC088387]|uniref:Rv1733c family protein n=1 Tax=Streptomyces sp. NPDC088387 TaxID=3365859 RepID=UPI0037FE2DA0